MYDIMETCKYFSAIKKKRKERKIKSSIKYLIKSEPDGMCRTEEGMSFRNNSTVSNCTLKKTFKNTSSYLLNCYDT